MAIFTVFFCGTGSQSEDHGHHNYVDGELISTLAKNAVGQETLDYIQVDGVGSGNLSEWRKHSKDDSYMKIRGKLGGHGINSNMNHVLSVLRGDEEDKGDYLSRSKSLLADIKPDRKAKFWHWNTTQAYKDWQRQTRDLSQDLKHAMSLQRANFSAERRRDPITRVNIVGWSRGGVSCFELANRMQNDRRLRDIEVNIFACDPVPGGMNTFKDYKTLGPNVKQVVCVFAQDERSLAFKARMPRLHPQTKYYTTLMPGRHATLVGNAHWDGGSGGRNDLTGPGKVTRDFMEKVLTGWGTRLKQSSMLHLRRANILNYYIQMFSNRDLYQDQHNEVYTIKDRRVSSGKDRIGQKRQSWMGIPTHRFQYPGITKDYRGAVNRHHRDVLDNNIFATQGISAALVNMV
ncbi:hypothetical protein [Vibrio tapetis]|uniref:DUF2235 domain-containing protein n=1 Tax=Vibrio tapetis subsp. tapetis TaxID=1671868 RepID=A0A2N8ZJR7_9VIBR|nr:hypothetical protein [Vibrio tapetis]SON52148.1 conserved protein of unknown function [Vibrio tapetis subsp. tapetis]